MTATPAAPWLLLLQLKCCGSLGLCAIIFRDPLKVKIDLRAGECPIRVISPGLGPLNRFGVFFEPLDGAVLDGATDLAYDEGNAANLAVNLQSRLECRA